MSAMSTPASTPNDSPIQPLHGQHAQIQIPQAPLGNANGLLNAQTSALGTKALLAKKLAKGKKKYNSPTDNMLTPCSAKLNNAKKKHFTRGKPVQLIFSPTPTATTEDFEADTTNKPETDQAVVEDIPAVTENGDLSMQEGEKENVAQEVNPFSSN